jgi:hypothetical protein
MVLESAGLSGPSCTISGLHLRFALAIQWPKPKETYGQKGIQHGESQQLRDIQ